MNESTPAPDPAESTLDKVARALVQWDHDGHDRREIGDNEALEVFGMFQADRNRLDAVIAQANLLMLADEGRFFKFLSTTSRFMTWGAGRNALLGMIWARVYEEASSGAKDQLLAGLLTNHDFFSPLYCVPEFVAQVAIEPERLADWFVQIRERLGDNMESTGLWGGIQSLADYHPASALEVLQLWTAQRPSEKMTSMAVSLLGRLRSQHPGSTEAIDHELSSHSDDLLRVVFHRSWVIYDQQTSIQPKDYRKLVECMAAGTPAEIGEAFHFVRCTLGATCRCDESFTYGIQWLRANAPTHADGVWAHWVINLANSCDDRALSMHLPPLRDLIPQLLPIPTGHDGTWHELETFLVKQLLENRAAFDELLFEASRRDREGVTKRFSPHGGFHELTARMIQHSPETTVAQALSSLDESVRLLGVRLFCYLGFDHLPPEVLGKWPDDWLANLICQVKREAFFDSGGIRILKAFIERVSQGSESLKAFLVDELIWQMKNLPGACLEPAKIEAEKLPQESLLRQAVSEAEQYFEKLKACFRSPINSMEVPGYRRAQRLENRKRSRQMSESTEKSSPLLSMISKSYTLYGGKQWQTYMGGNLTPPSTMQEFSQSFEFPRMFILDPDGDSLRNRHACALMTELVAAEQKRRESNHDS